MKLHGTSWVNIVDRIIPPSHRQCKNYLEKHKHCIKLGICAKILHSRYSIFCINSAVFYYILLLLSVLAICLTITIYCTMG